jgi:hypothetical protein
VLLIRLRYLTLKLRALCWALRRLRRPGRLRGWSERAVHVAKRKEINQ